MNIKSERIKLRAIEDYDEELLYALINDPEIEKNTTGNSFPVSISKQREWIKQQQLNSSATTLRTIIEDNNSKEAIGTLILSDIDYKNGTAELHIKILNKFQRKGYATESVDLISKYASKELRLHSIYVNILKSNINSQNLFKKCGFELDGYLRDRVFKDGQFQDLASFSRILGE